MRLLSERVRGRLKLFETLGEFAELLGKPLGLFGRQLRCLLFQALGGLDGTVEVSLLQCIEQGLKWVSPARGLRDFIKGEFGQFIERSLGVGIQLFGLILERLCCPFEVSCGFGTGLIRREGPRFKFGFEFIDGLLSLDNRLGQRLVLWRRGGDLVERCERVADRLRPCEFVGCSVDCALAGGEPDDRCSYETGEHHRQPERAAPFRSGHRRCIHTFGGLQTLIDGELLEWALLGVQHQCCGESTVQGQCIIQRSGGFERVPATRPSEERRCEHSEHQGDWQQDQRRPGLPEPSHRAGRKKRAHQRRRQRPAERPKHFADGGPRCGPAGELSDVLGHLRQFRRSSQEWLAPWKGLDAARSPTPGRIRSRCGNTLTSLHVDRGSIAFRGRGTGCF